MPTELEWAYLAGIIDGEGTVDLRVRTDRLSPAIIYRLVVSNTDKNLMDWIHERFGGRLSTQHYGGNTTRGICYGMNWYSKSEMLRILGGVMPYLVIKHWVAETVVGILSLPRNMIAEKIHLTNLMKEVQYYGK